MRKRQTMFSIILFLHSTQLNTDHTSWPHPVVGCIGVVKEGVQHQLRGIRVVEGTCCYLQPKLLQTLKHSGQSNGLNDHDTLHHKTTSRMWAMLACITQYMYMYILYGSHMIVAMTTIPVWWGPVLQLTTARCWRTLAKHWLHGYHWVPQVWCMLHVWYMHSVCMRRQKKVIIV